MNGELKARHLSDAVRALSMQLGGVELEYEVKSRPDGPFLLFAVADPHERFFRSLETALRSLPEDNPFRDRATIVKRNKSLTDRLSLPEAKLLRAAISESLTIDRYSFEEDFFSRYTSSVTNFEDQITTNANFIVYGRRGSGKSSLLAYAMHTLRRLGRPFIWIAMQVFAGRTDARVTVDVFSELVSQLRSVSHDEVLLSRVERGLGRLSSVSERLLPRELAQLLPDIRRAIGTAVSSPHVLTVFLDDFHVIGESIQPSVLNSIYAVTRGNRSFIKLSGIEQFCRPWNGRLRTGLEPNHDAQILRLDHNLTVPDKSKKHIVGILDAHARYCGLPNIGYLASDEALSRLVWVAAAVPRDALSLFSAAAAKGLAKGEKRVSVTSTNAAASESAEAKLRDIDQDAADQKDKLSDTLTKVKDFCITSQKKNAFLLEIKNRNSTFQAIQGLIALRLVHILHEGITPHEAGRRFMALMLDYGFYVGIRAAKSVDLFQHEPQTILAKDLRRLPVFPLTNQE
jgi:hypothetical protein